MYTKKEDTMEIRTSFTVPLGNYVAIKEVCLPFSPSKGVRMCFWTKDNEEQAETEIAEADYDMELQ